MKTKFKPGDIVQAEVKWTDAGSLIFEFIGEGKINRAGVGSDFFTLAPAKETPLQEAERELIAATLDYRRSRPDPVPAYSYPLILKVFEAADKVIALQAPPMTDLQIAISALEMLTTYFTVSDDDRVKIAQSALNKIKGSK